MMPALLREKLSCGLLPLAIMVLVPWALVISPAMGQGTPVTAAQGDVVGGVESIDDPFQRPDNRRVHPPADAPRFRVVGVAEDDRLNIRNIPGVEGSVIIGRLAPDATNVALADGVERVHGSTWVEVWYAGLPGGSGWVNAHYLDPLPESEQPAVAPDITSGEMRHLANLYTDVAGYRPLEASTAEARLLDEYAGDDSEAYRALNRAGPLTRALLLLESEEAPLAHARYRIRFGMEQMGPYDPKAYRIPVSFVQIDRFNMGPVRPKSLADVPDAAPHVSYRLVMRPVQSVTAATTSMARAELTDAQAEAMACLDVGCLSPASVAESVPQQWKETHEGDIAFSAPYPMMTTNGTHSPAAVVDQLTVQNGFLAEVVEESVRWSYPEPREGLTFGAPFIDVTIDVNLAQDFAVEGVLRDSHLMDDDLAIVWERFASISSADPTQPLVFAGRALQRHPWRE